VIRGQAIFSADVCAGDTAEFGLEPAAQMPMTLGST
jgi:hypothetical protein